MNNFCIFAGTTEGRELAEFLTAQGCAVTACVATEYGEALLPPAEGLTVRSGRMDREEMTGLLREKAFDLVLDATHPYAAEASENIRAACADGGAEYCRVLRDGSARPEGTVFAEDIPAALDYLNSREGNILLTTGSKELGAFAGLRDFSRRVWARVLPLESSLEACKAAGLPASHILAMQGPFSEDLNAALLRSMGGRFLVTKDSGGPGGFQQKADAARRAGATLVVLGRPPQGEGRSLPETIRFLCERYGLARRPAVSVVGLGPGSRESMTGEVRAAIDGADCLIGAKRMLESVEAPGKGGFDAVAPEKIAEYVFSHPEYRRFAVVMSGDTGFFSGTKKLLPLLKDCDVRVLPGLSSLSVLCARLGTSYEDVTPLSLHGRRGHVAPAVRANAKVFALTGGTDGVNALCRELREAGLGRVRVTVGERLSYPEERITSGTAEALEAGTYDSLSALLIENDAPDAVVTSGLPDSAFLRDEATPMTKSEVRAVCLGKLRLTERSICWDVGAGTGSVSVEMALRAKKGQVYAVERSEAAVALLRENAARFALDNLTVVPGSAPEACGDLPAPTHVFIGGSGGGLREVLRLALEKNPAVRIVATAVTLETVGALTACMKELPFPETEAVSLTVARDRKAGPYRLMTGQNPVYIFTMQAGEREP